MAYYDAKSIEKKWQKKWKEDKTYYVDLKTAKKPFYNLCMFPYPSGAALHIGHWYNYSGTDTYGRFKRLLGYDVFQPIGFDSFGLPAENYAIKTGIPPKESIKKNIEVMKKQIEDIGTIFQWENMVNTSDPSYYKWTQWIFTKMYEKGLAVKRKAPVNWCPKCQTVLANEQVKDNKCERCDTVVERRNMMQWFFRMSKYAQRLLDGLDTIDWPQTTKNLQRIWIGRSEGTNVKFKIEKQGKLLDFEIEIFTTRVDTIFGVTFITLSPEHPLVDLIVTDEYKDLVKEYQIQASKKSEIERTDLTKEKTGVFTGSYAINPVNNEKVPIWISDYVMMHYGTGAVMAVPAHDERDYAFAKKYGIPIKNVIARFIGEESSNFTQRTVAYGVLFDKETQKYGFVIWEKTGCPAIAGGGIHEDESIEDGLKREIEEETGYHVFKNIIKIDTLIVSSYFSKVRNLWLKNNINVYLIEVSKSHVKEPQKEDYEDHLIFKWGTAKEFLELSKSKDFDNKYYVQTNVEVFKQAVKMCIELGWDKTTKIEDIDFNINTEDGILFNSGKFSGLKSDQARIEITKYLKSINAGDFKINYKLRDWLVSRQRYWGAPIPVVYDLKEKQEIEKMAINVDLFDQEKFIQIFDNERKVEIFDLNDEKYSKLNVNDILRFTNKITDEKVYTKILDIKKYASLNDLLNDKDILDQILINKKINNLTDLKEILRLTEKEAYNADNYGFIAILFQKIDPGIKVLNESELPVLLPDNIQNYKPQGKSPLADVDSFVNIDEYTKREVDTLDTFVCSSWYYLRYLSPNDDKKPFPDDKEFLNKWRVHMYIGGAEHACMHLIFIRFVHMVLYDMGYLDYPEPIMKLVHQGLIIKDGAKMSKSKGNVINPDTYVETYGSDVFRTYLLFMGPYEEGGDFSDKGIVGISRFFDKVWKLVNDFSTVDENKKETIKLNLLHKIIKFNKENYEKMRFNVVIAKLMELVNWWQDNKDLLTKSQYLQMCESTLKMMAPIAPHLTEELWSVLGYKDSIHKQLWPEADENLCVDDVVKIVVQINGKVRANVEVNFGLNKDEVLQEVLKIDNVKKYILDKKNIKNIVYIQDKLINIVI